MQLKLRVWIIMETGFIKRSNYYSVSFDNFVGWGDYGTIDENIANLQESPTLSVSFSDKHKIKNPFNK